MQNSYSQEELQCAQTLLSLNLSDSNETNERITRCCSPVVYPDDLERTIRENVANGLLIGLMLINTLFPNGIKVWHLLLLLI